MSQHEERNPATTLTMREERMFRDMLNWIAPQLGDRAVQEMERMDSACEDAPVEDRT